MYCEGCGKELLDEQRYCSRCGTPRATFAPNPRSGYVQPPPIPVEASGPRYSAPPRISIGPEFASLLKQVVSDPVGNLATAVGSVDEGAAPYLAGILPAANSLLLPFVFYVVAPAWAKPGFGRLFALFFISLLAFAGSVVAGWLVNTGQLIIERGRLIRSAIFVAVSLIPTYLSGVIVLLIGAPGLAVPVLVFAFSYSILLIHTGTKEIERAREPRAALSVAVRLLVFAGITWAGV